MRDDHEILIATITATLQAVAVVLIMATGFVWLAIYATGSGQ